MSRIDQATENPNDKLPAGKPLDPDRIVSEDDAGSAAIAEEAETERSERGSDEDFEGLDNDLVNVGKFTDPAVDDNGAEGSIENDESGSQAPEVGRSPDFEPDEDAEHPGIPANWAVS